MVCLRCPDVCPSPLRWPPSRAASLQLLPPLPPLRRYNPIWRRGVVCLRCPDARPGVAMASLCRASRAASSAAAAAAAASARLASAAAISWAMDSVAAFSFLRCSRREECVDCTQCKRHSMHISTWEVQTSMRPQHAIMVYVLLVADIILHNRKAGLGVVAYCICMGSPIH